MPEPQTVSQVMAKLEEEGYTQGFRAYGQLLHVFPKGIEVDPDDLVVDMIYRFEGESNLDDEEIIFALSCCKRDIKGTYLVAFGPKMDRRDNVIVQKLQKRCGV